MKQVIPLHGDDHTMGGPDPFRPEFPYIFAHDDSTGQTVSATAELTFYQAKTNDLFSEESPQGTFGVDPDDPEGILIYRNGLYQIVTDVGSGESSTPRAIYPAWSRLSNGPLWSVGNPLNPGIGAGQGAASISTVSATGTISKTRLYHFALTTLDTTGLDPLAGDPFRLAVVLEHDGTNWTIGGSNGLSSVTVMRVSGLAKSIDYTP